MFGSPTAYLLWAILSCIFLTYLVLHLWSYDRFKCLLWRGGKQPSTFRRIMTYSYLGTVPLILIFSAVTTAIKFQEGFIAIPGGEIVPKPPTQWGPRNQRWIQPLYFVLSTAWGLELFGTIINFILFIFANDGFSLSVTHFEELAFWLFLLHQGPGKRDWFHSWEYRAWCIGSIVSITGMPIVVLISRRQIETCLSWIFLIGASAGTFTTLLFLYVLARFPAFLLHVKSEGAEPGVVVRLATFYHLNRIRVVFRFVFTVPLVLLATDGISAPFPVVAHPFALDFLLMVSAIGCTISSAITLLIFFPRSILHEVGYCEMIRPSKAPRTTCSSAPPKYYSNPHASSQTTFVREIQVDSFRFPDTSDQDSFNLSHHSLSQRNSTESNLSPGYETDAESIGMASHTLPSKIRGSTSMLPPSDDMMWDRGEESAAVSSLRRRHSDSYFHNRHWRFSSYATTHSHDEGQAHPSTSSLGPYVLNFTSPIDLTHSYSEHDG